MEPTSTVVPELHYEYSYFIMWGVYCIGSNRNVDLFQKEKMVLKNLATTMWQTAVSCLVDTVIAHASFISASIGMRLSWKNSQKE